MIDLLLGAILILILFLPILCVSILVKLTSKGPIIFWSDRIGVNNTTFSMPKFRTMLVDTPQVATHLLKDANNNVTRVGIALRALSIDELPQLYSILKGDMSLIGPRPALFNQFDLIELRTKSNVHLITPGLTGWAQISGRDELSIEEKVVLDKEYLDSMSLSFDLKILLVTALKVIRRKGISH